MKNGIAKILEISTAHIERSDNDLLKIETGFSVASFEYGFYLFIPENKSTIKEYSESFKKAFRYAKENDCRFILLDCDAAILETEKLNTNKW